MPFRFLQYLQPTRYFIVPKLDGKYAYPDVSDLPREIVNSFSIGMDYKTETAKAYDISWQCLNNGYIGDTRCYLEFKRLPIVDEYIFIKRYFNPIWVLYVFIIRLLSFKNPISECKAFLASKKVSRLNSNRTIILDEGVNYFQSNLLIQQPKVSIIIPTLNRYRYLKNVLHDIEAQTYKNVEVLIVDQSDGFSKDFYKQFNLDIQLFRQKEKALWLARNTAVEQSEGEYLLFFDDDSRVQPDWIEQHLNCLDYFNADASSGVSLSDAGDIPTSYSFYRISDQLDTGNVLLKKEVFRKIGLFDRQFEKQRMGDGEFGMRMYMHGFKNISNPNASRIHLKVGSGGLRHMGSWDAFRTNRIFAPRPIPSVLYFFRRYFGNKNACLALLKSVPPSIIPYRFKKNKKLLVLGIFTSILLLPLILLQVIISWRKASKKIFQGPSIKTID